MSTGLHYTAEYNFKEVVKILDSYDAFMYDYDIYYEDDILDPSTAKMADYIWKESKPSIISGIQTTPPKDYWSGFT